MLLKNNRGITLIALVITILVLLILAGISLSGIMGNNSIIDMSKEARYKAEVKDVIDLWKSKTANLDVSDLSVDSIEEILAIESIPESLRGKLAIENGEIVFKDLEDFTDDEIRWLIESGIYKQFVNSIHVNIIAAIESVVQVQEVVTSKEPFDVVMVLDKSTSMNKNDAFNQMMTSVNAFMKIILGANEDNRLGIVVYFYKARDVLPLAHYLPAGEDGNYVVPVNKNNFEWKTSVSPLSGGQQTIRIDTVSERGTNINSGMARGIKMINGGTLRTVEGAPNTATKQRKKCIFLLTDGIPSTELKTRNNAEQYKNLSIFNDYLDVEMNSLQSLNGSGEYSGPYSFRTILLLDTFKRVYPEIDLYSFYYDTSHLEDERKVGSLIMDFSESNLNAVIGDPNEVEVITYTAGTHPLENALFTFDNVSGTSYRIHNGNNYLGIYNKVISGTSKEITVTNNSNGVAFSYKYSNSKTYNLQFSGGAFKYNRNASSVFTLYEPTSNTSESSAEIPGYKKVLNFENGKSYLITYKEGEKIYILYPSTSSYTQQLTSTSSNNTSNKDSAYYFKQAAKDYIDYLRNMNNYTSYAYDGDTSSEAELIEKFAHIATTMVSNNNTSSQIETQFTDIVTSKNIVLKDDLSYEDRENNEIVYYKIKLDGTLTVRARISVFKPTDNIDEKGNLIREMDPNRVYEYSKSYTMQQIINGIDPNIVYNGKSILWKITSAFNTKRDSFRNLAIRDAVNHPEITYSEANNESLDIAEVDFVIPVFVDHTEPLLGN